MGEWRRGAWQASVKPWRMAPQCGELKAVLGGTLVVRDLDCPGPKFEWGLAVQELVGLRR